MGFSLILRAFFSFPNERQFIECQFFWEFRMSSTRKIVSSIGYEAPFSKAVYFCTFTLP